MDMEWCLKDPSQLKVLRVFQVPVATPVVGVRTIPVRVRAEQNTKDAKATAAAFGRVLAQDPEARKRCKDKDRFKTEFSAWRERELAKGRVHRGAPSSILYKLSQLTDEQCKSLGCVRCNVVGSVIHFSDSSGNHLAGAAQRVRESRPKVEANKFGIVVTPPTQTRLFQEDVVVDHGERLRRSLTVHNTTKAACQMAVRVLNRMSGAHGFSCPSIPNGTNRVLAPGQGDTPHPHARGPSCLSLVPITLHYPPPPTHTPGAACELSCT
jgi:hypothetical protein